MEPSDDDVRDLLERGEPVRFEIPRRIPSRWLDGLIKNRTRILSMPVFIENAVFDGDLRLSHVTFESDFILLGCTVEGKADFRFSLFKQSARFSGTRFVGAPTFSAAKAEGDFEANGATFPDGSVLNDLTVGQVFSATGAHFGSCDLSRLETGKFLDCAGGEFNGNTTFADAQIGGDARFDGAQFSSAADFHGFATRGSIIFAPGGKMARHVRFAGAANFAYIKVGTNSLFPCAVFGKQALFAGSDLGLNAIFAGATFSEMAYFANVVVHQDAVFIVHRVDHISKPVTFGADARFDSIHVIGNAIFRGARFGGLASFHMAQIDGQLELAEVDFRETANFMDSHIGMVASFSGAQFGARAQFGRTEVGAGLVFCEDGPPDRRKPVTFSGPADFVELRAKGEVVFEGSVFEDVAAFDRMQSDQVLQFTTRDGGEPVVFKRNVSFCGARVMGQALFQTTRFEGEAAFLNAVFGNEVSFAGATFAGSASFDRAALGTTARFDSNGRDPVRFLSDCGFRGATIDGDLVLTSTQFCGRASFDGLRIGGSIFLRSDAKVGMPAWFAEEARFNGMTVTGSAEFQGARFRGDARFDGAAFKGPVHFAPDLVRGKKVYTRFKGQAVFTSASFGSKAAFSFCRFRSDALFESAQFNVDAHFDGAVFLGKAYFPGANVSGFAFFQGVTFTQKVTFAGACVSSAYFGLEGVPGLMIDKETTFGGKVDLRGLTYQRIAINWKSALRKQEPFDREPYSLLEAQLRSRGEEHKASLVYLERCKRENRGRRERLRAAWGAPGTLWERLGTIVGESLGALYHGTQGMLFGYGVRPFRLLLLSLVLIAVGACVFSMKDAVRPASSPADSAPALRYTQALGLSMRLFVPVVELPSGEAWKPSAEPCRFLGLEHIGLSYEGYASMHRLLGALFIPLLVAVSAGAFYRGKR